MEFILPAATTLGGLYLNIETYHTNILFRTLVRPLVGKISPCRHTRLLTRKPSQLRHQSLPMDLQQCATIQCLESTPNALI